MNNITLAKVAKVANVSTNTVSRALNDKPDINPKTKKRILRIAEDLGYVLNFPAKSLRSRKTGIIGVIVTDISNPFSATVVKGIQDVIMYTAQWYVDRYDPEYSGRTISLPD